ncbi:MAG: Acetyl-coenzyme A carboxylase carboxyl transferase subunit alpha [candidate division WS2 bacterium]|nr:Acetyl-coenzyme A carboxylase carboxyl transferase subunit alpha [Candidatus Psychracetigena formicireducens]
MEDKLTFELPLLEMEEKIRLLVEKEGETKNTAKLTLLLKKKEEEIYQNLTPWQVVQLARYQGRPRSLDYINIIFENFLELHGDRRFGDDPAVVGGLAFFNKHTVMVIAQQKGRGVDDNLFRRFGMPYPEGYRKAQRLMRLAEKMKIPLITLVDTPGAYPGIESEERGQAEAISLSISLMLSLKIPTIAVIIGEGGSGGALALASGDKILMLKYSIFSVISPEGCAAILWKDEKYAEKAAGELKLTAKDLLKLKIIDVIIEEPLRGAHYHPEQVARNISDSLSHHLNLLRSLPLDTLVQLRKEKYLKIGKL